MRRYSWGGFEYYLFNGWTPISSDYSINPINNCHDNNMKNDKDPSVVAMFYDANIFQQLLFYYLKKEVRESAFQLETIQSADSLFEMISSGRVDVLITHFRFMLNLPDWGLPENISLEQLCRRHGVRRILLIDDDERWPLSRIINMKYEVTLSLKEDVDELAAAFKRLLCQNVAVPYVSPGLRKGTRREHVSLSSKEWEVLWLLAQGQSLSEIASWKRRSVSTIATQKHNALKKLGISNSGEFIKFLQITGGFNV